MVMKHLVLIAIIGLLGACGKDSTQSATNAAPVQRAAPTETQIKCSESAECTAYCKQQYPYIDPTLINQDCARRGILGSGICNQMQTDNATLGQQQVACLAQLINY